MRSAIRRLAHDLPPNAAGALALAGLFVVISALALVAPRTPRERAEDLAVASAPPSSSTTAPPGATPATGRVLFPQPGDPGVLLVTPALPQPTPAPAPLGLGAAPEAGGIIFRIYAGSVAQRGVWRYDGATGTVRRLGSSGEPTGDGRGYVVRQDDAQYVRVDAATGSVAPIAPLGALSADAGPAGSDVIGAHVEGAAWITLRDGSTKRVAGDLTASTVRISPDGRRLALVVAVPDPAAANVRRPPTIATELWTLDLPDGAPRLLVRLRAGEMVPQIQLGPWSPDGTLLAYWEVSISNSINADGVALRAVDVRSGAIHDLGTTLYGASRLSWKAPHTLAFVSGGGRGTWDHKAVRIWSPEAGATDVTTSGIGLNPSWSADGTKLYLVSAQEHVYDPVQYWAGRDSGDRRLGVYEIATRRLATFERLSGYAYEGVRAGRDGTHLLVLWRSTYFSRSVNELPPVEMTLGLFEPATGRTKPLVRLAGDVGFGYYGSYEGPESMAWSEGR